jgi:hypothetical protein
VDLFFEGLLIVMTLVIAAVSLLIIARLFKGQD